MKFVFKDPLLGDLLHLSASGEHFYFGIETFFNHLNGTPDIQGFERDFTI